MGNSSWNIQKVLCISSLLVFCAFYALLLLTCIFLLIMTKMKWWEVFSKSFHVLHTDFQPKKNNKKMFINHSLSRAPSVFFISYITALTLLCRTYIFRHFSWFLMNFYLKKLQLFIKLSLNQIDWWKFENATNSKMALLSSSKSLRYSCTCFCWKLECNIWKRFEMIYHHFNFVIIRRKIHVNNDKA